MNPEDPIIAALLGLSTLQPGALSAANPTTPRDRRRARAANPTPYISDPRLQAQPDAMEWAGNPVTDGNGLGLPFDFGDVMNTGVKFAAGMTGLGMVNALGIPAAASRAAILGGAGGLFSSAIPGLPLITENIPKFIEKLRPWSEEGMIEEALADRVSPQLNQQLTLISPEEYLRFSPGRYDLLDGDMLKPDVVRLLRTGFENVSEIPSLIFREMSPASMVGRALDVADLAGEAVDAIPNMGPFVRTINELAFRGGQLASDFIMENIPQIIEADWPDELVGRPTYPAAAQVAEALGWDLMPTTVTRIGDRELSASELLDIMQGESWRLGIDEDIARRLASEDLDESEMEFLREQIRNPPLASSLRSTIDVFDEEAALPFVRSPIINRDAEGYRRAIAQLRKQFLESREYIPQTEEEFFQTMMQRRAEFDSLVPDNFYSLRELTDEQRSIYDAILERTLERSNTRNTWDVPAGLFDDIMDRIYPAIRAYVTGGR